MLDTLFSPLLHRLFLDHFLFLDSIEKIQEKLKFSLNTFENIMENGAFVTVIKIYFAYF